MKLDTLIDGHHRKCRVQAKVPECPSVCVAICLSGVISLSYTLDTHVFFFMIFTFFVENY